MKWTQIYLLVLLSVFTLAPNSLAAQDESPGEPDTEAFLESNFLLQDVYTNVLCVAGDDSCPSQITTRVPCLTQTCSHPETTYTVASTFSTIQTAADSAEPGDLILIMPGRYRGVEVEARGGEDGAYIHFLGWGEPGTIIIDAPARPDVAYLRHHFYFLAAHHYVIQNLAFERAENGAGVFLSGYFSATGQFAHHFIITDVYSHDNGVWGLHTSATSSVVIQDSIFTNSREEHGVYISGSGDNMLIRRNVFQGNNAAGLQINPDPQTATSELFYWLQASTGDTCGWTEEAVEGTGAATWEDLKACYDDQGLPDLGQFLEDGISEAIIVEQNVATGNGAAGGAGINLASLRRSVVRNNLIYGNAAAAITCWDNLYAEQKGLDASPFGCQDVTIVNNTMVDEAAGRGAVILSANSRDLTVVNNIIVRDRVDAYEVIEGASLGLRSSHNYYSALDIEEAPGALILDSDSASGSIRAPTVADALNNFVRPGFAPWVLEDAGWPALHPDRPDYHLRADSVLATGGDISFAPVFDMSATLRSGTEIGAFTVTGFEAAVASAIELTSTAVGSTQSVPAVSAVVTPASSPPAADLFVDDDNTSSVEDGSSLYPYRTVQQAIDAASDGAVIAVAAGTYTENIVVRGVSVHLYGGYAGGSSGDFTTRNPAMYPSHLQGDGQDSVVTLVEAGTSVVDGFRITNGSRSLEGVTYCCQGGGIYITGGAPTIVNNVIEDNDTRTASDPNVEMVGGGIYAQNADVSILNNLIRNNTSGRGAGIAVAGGIIVIRGNTVEGNIGVSDHGGGMYIAATDAEISENLIVGNEIGRDLGYGWGGGIIVFNPGSVARLSYNRITRNYAPSVGSGVFIDDGATAFLDHELVYANECSSMGGVGIYVDGPGNGAPGSTVSIRHTTVADHTCETSQGGNALYVEQNSTVSIQNSILWDNGGDDVIVDGTSQVNITYTLSEEVIEGTGNLSVDPLFADAANSDFHLRSTVGRWDAANSIWVQDSSQSPAIDAGDPASAFDAEREPNGGRADLGAYGNTAQASMSN